MNRDDTIKLQLKLQEKTSEANELRAKLRKNDSHLRGIIRQLEQFLDEAGVPWRDRMEINRD